MKSPLKSLGCLVALLQHQRSSACATWSWPVPLPPRDFCFTAPKESWPGSRYDGRFTYQLKYWWGTYHFKNTYSPITLANISSINLVSIFRCSGSLINPVYVRHVDNEWVLISTCKQLVWSTRIGRNMSIWILYLILGSGPGTALTLEVAGYGVRSLFYTGLPGDPTFRLLVLFNLVVNKLSLPARPF